MNISLFICAIGLPADGLSSSLLRLQMWLSYGTTAVYYLLVCRFPPSEHLVIAFTGAPASFPVDQRNVELHRYLHWSDYINHLADQFIRETFSGQPFIGIHMRNGEDWVGSVYLSKIFTKIWLFIACQIFYNMCVVSILKTSGIAMLL